LLNSTFLVVLLISTTAWFLGRGRALAIGNPALLHSRPVYHGFYSAIWTGIAGITAALIIIVIFGESGVPVLIAGSLAHHAANHSFVPGS